MHHKSDPPQIRNNSTFYANCNNRLNAFIMKKSGVLMESLTRAFHIYFRLHNWSKHLGQINYNIHKMK